MNKRAPALLLAISLLLTVPALAAPDSTENFVRGKTYTGQFSDLTSDSVFYDNVAALYEYGLSVGKPDGTYGLQDSMTVGQVVIFAGRIRSLYRTGDPEQGPAAYAGDGPAALPYLRYLQAEGVLGTELDGSLSDTATRAQVAHVLARVLPEEALPPVHDALITQALATGRYMTDVTDATPYREDILTLYRAGLSVGSNAFGSFLPDAPITRGAAAAMLTRMVAPSLRVTPSWNVSARYTRARGATLASLVPDGTYTAAPTTDQELEGCVRHMLSSGSNVLSLQYAGISPLGAREVMEQALAITKSYCEQSYNTATCTFNEAGSLTLTFSATGAGENEIGTYRTQAMAAAISLHDQLWESGQLTADMTEYEKARVYYTWICENCVYDFSAGTDSISHIPYSLFYNGTAVCDGYTGAYNLLLKLEGIECSALSTGSHIWTVANLDGTEVHIDTTWGDSGSTISYDYFAMTPSQSWTYHSW